MGSLIENSIRSFGQLLKKKIESTSNIFKIFQFRITAHNDVPYDNMLERFENVEMLAPNTKIDKDRVGILMQWGGNATQF